MEKLTIDEIIESYEEKCEKTELFYMTQGIENQDKIPDKTYAEMNQIIEWLKELKRWRTDHVNKNIKNEFANRSTLCCHNCDHKDEYIEELEGELERYKDIGLDPEEIEEKINEYNGWVQGWIPVINGLPEDADIHEITAKSRTGILGTDYGYYCEEDREWYRYNDSGPINVISWRHPSEPYNPGAKIIEEKECENLPIENKDNHILKTFSCHGCGFYISYEADFENMSKNEYEKVIKCPVCGSKMKEDNFLKEKIWGN